MVPEGRETMETFLARREEIFAAFGGHLWPDEAGEAVRRKLSYLLKHSLPKVTFTLSTRNTAVRFCCNIFTRT